MAVADLKQFQTLLESPNLKSALLILPQNPNLDMVAAALSLRLALDKRGISAVVSSPTPMIVEFNRLVAVEQIREDLGDKNLVVSFADYDADNIERVAYNIDNGQFALTVVPKPGQTAPKQDQIIVSYAGIASDLIIAVGANYPHDLGKFSQIREIVEHQNLVLLGNTPLSGWPRSIELIDPTETSVSQVVYQIIKELNLPFDEDIATNLFLGLENGTQNFTHPKIGAQTFALASELLSAGARRGAVQPQRFEPQRRKPNPQHTEQTVMRDSSNIG